MFFFVNKFLMALIFLALFTLSANISYAQKKIIKKSKINYRKVEFVDSSIGYASFYADKFVGRKTSSGELFSQKKLTCAHNTLPFGTMIRVTNLANDSSVVVKVNDRLNQRNPRIVDLSKSAAKKLNFSGRGLLKVRVELVNQFLEDNQTKNQ